MDINTRVRINLPGHQFDGCIGTIYSNTVMLHNMSRQVAFPLYRGEDVVVWVPASNLVEVIGEDVW